MTRIRKKGELAAGNKRESEQKRRHLIKAPAFGRPGKVHMDDGRP